MCESTVYIRTASEDQQLMTEVASMKCEGESITLEGVLGETMIVRGRVLLVDFLGHKVIITQ